MSCIRVLITIQSADELLRTLNLVCARFSVKDILYRRNGI